MTSTRYFLFTAIIKLQTWIAAQILPKIEGWEELDDTGVVLTGSSALARLKISQEANELLAQLAPLGAEVMARRVNVEGFVEAITVGTSIEASSIIYSTEEVNKQLEFEKGLEQQQQQNLVMGNNYE